MMTSEKPLPVGTKAAEPERILFVCTGNTCRSPMAAALFNDLEQKRVKGAGGCRVAFSAGLYAKAGDPITPAAVAALQAAGIQPTKENDYPAHFARPVTAEEMALADEVVAVSDSHAMELLMRFPEAAAKISVLPMNIPDPFGGTQEVYRQCLDTLRYALILRFFPEDGEQK